jgi:HSP20 family protein
MRADRNPFAALEGAIDRLSREFERATQSLESGDVTAMEEFGVGTLAADVADRGEAFVVTLDVPGFDREEISVRVTDRTIRVEAERETTTEEGDEHYIRKERRHESFERAVTLPEEIDAQAVTASMDNGVLTITVPKATPVEAGTEIEIE